MTELHSWIALAAFAGYCLGEWRANQGWITRADGNTPHCVRRRFYFVRSEATEVQRQTELIKLQTSHAILAGRAARSADAAEAKLARIRERIERNHVHTSDQLRALLEEP